MELSPTVIIMLIGLAFNFVTLLIGLAGLFAAMLRFSVRLENRLTHLETQMDEVMRARGVTPRQRVPVRQS